MNVRSNSKIDLHIGPLVSLILVLIPRKSQLEIVLLLASSPLRELRPREAQTRPEGAARRVFLTSIRFKTLGQLVRRLVPGRNRRNRLKVQKVLGFVYLWFKL